MNKYKNIRKRLIESQRIAKIEKKYWEIIYKKMLMFSNSIKNLMNLTVDELKLLSETRETLTILQYEVSSVYAQYANGYVLLVIPRQSPKAWEYLECTDSIPKGWILKQSLMNPVLLPDKESRNLIQETIKQLV